MNIHVNSCLRGITFTFYFPRCSLFESTNFQLLIEHCAEFNEMGAVVQDNYYTDCTRLEPPCPTILQFCRSLQMQVFLMK